MLAPCRMFQPLASISEASNLFLDIWLLKSQVFVLWQRACCAASAQVHSTPFHPIPSLHNTFNSIPLPPIHLTSQHPNPNQPVSLCSAIVLYVTLLYFTLLYFTLLYFTLLYFSLLYSSLLTFIFLRFT